jgi:nicotinamide-nucleotide adenylyltransferase
MPQSNQSKPSHIPLAAVGMVARWQPVHLGHKAVLQALCKSADRVHIGIGSANVTDYRSPFTLEEVTDMLGITLDGWDNYTLHPIPDLNDGPRWREMVADLFGPLDAFYTDNPYVASLMGEVYEVRRPVHLLRDQEQIAVSGTQVRKAMARGEDWQALLPSEIAAYMQVNRLDGRFRDAFGLQTLALETIVTERSN